MKNRLQTFCSKFSLLSLKKIVDHGGSFGSEKPTNLAFFVDIKSIKKNTKIVNQLIPAYFLIQNKNLFSDLIYHERKDIIIVLNYKIKIYRKFK